MITIADRVAEFRFKVKSDNKTHVVVFKVSEDALDTECSCGVHKHEKHCWHARYILAGRTRRLVEGQHIHAELLKKLVVTKWGKQALDQAKQEFSRMETSCRRCGSQNVIFLRHSLFGKFVSLFKPNSHHHYCKSCKWSW